LPSLASILEPLSDALTRYCLSATAALGILDRAERRGLRLEEPLRTALLSTSQEKSGTEPTA
jgi:hypothetical protein